MIVPYLYFDGDANEALEFYQEAFGGEAQIVRYGDLPNASRYPQNLHHLIHKATLTFNGRALCLVDSEQPEQAQGQSNISLAVVFHFSDDVQQAFDTLTIGGKIQIALGETMQSALYGRLTDRYGVNWHIVYE